MGLKSDEFSKLFTFQEQIGKGSFGEVYKCLNNQSRQVVAVKIIDLEKSEDEIDDIQQELKFLSSCFSEYITRYHSSHVIGTKLYIVMEYLAGGSVHDLLKPGPLEEPYCQVILRDVCHGLQYLHEQNKIHRDIKCANILVSDRGNVKLADFGVAGQLTETLNKRSTFVGTPFWMAPEVIKQSGYGCPADIWSLGITAIELADTKPPYNNVHPMKVLFMITSNPSPEPTTSVSKPYRDFISQCLNKEPSDRPTARELLKHKFIKSAKRSQLLVFAIERYRNYCKNQEQKQSSAISFVDKDDHQEESPEWLFETIKSVRNAEEALKSRKEAEGRMDQKSESVENEKKEKSKSHKPAKVEKIEQKPSSLDAKSNSAIVGFFKFFQKNKDKEVHEGESLAVPTDTVKSGQASSTTTPKVHNVTNILQQLTSKRPSCAQTLTDLIAFFTENYEAQTLLTKEILTYVNNYSKKI